MRRPVLAPLVGLVAACSPARTPTPDLASCTVADHPFRASIADGADVTTTPDRERRVSNACRAQRSTATQ